MTHPWIARAEVSRKWPNSLHLTIQERDPVALVQIGEELLYMDRQGMIFKPLSPGDPHNFPVITGLTPDQFKHPAGELPEVVAQAFQLMDLLKTTSPPLNLGNISEIHVDLERGFTLYANGMGVALDIGLKDYSEKLQKFVQLWPALVQRGLVARVGRINLTYPRRVLVTLKGMEANP
jgi:cell division septal protein FtsQ